MAQQPDMLEMNNDSSFQLLKECLEDFGIPAQKLYQIADVYYSCYDYMRDVKLFKDNYDAFTKIQSTAAKVKTDLDTVKTHMGDLYNDIHQKDSVFQYFGIFRSVDADKMNQLELHTEQMESGTKDFDEIFKSKEATMMEADEVLNRKNTMRVIQLLVVFKDVVFGVHKCYKNSRAIKGYNERFNEIYTKYVKPTLDQFDQDGTVNVDLVERGLFCLKVLKTNIIQKQYDTKQSIITHSLNAVTTCLNAYATFSNIGLMKGIASSSALLYNYVLGSSQLALCVGSITLSGIEFYNYNQYSTLIENIEAAIKVLDDRGNYLQMKKAQ